MSQIKTYLPFAALILNANVFVVWVEYLCKQAQMWLFLASCMLILLLHIVCVSYSKQLWFTSQCFFKGRHAICCRQNSQVTRDLYYYLFLYPRVSFSLCLPMSMPMFQCCVTRAQQDIKNAEGHLKMIVAAHSGMFRGFTNPPPTSPPAHGP